MAHIREGWANKPVTWVSHGGCARLCEVGGQAAAARMGMAIRGARKRWPDAIPGAIATGPRLHLAAVPGCPRRSGAAPDKGRACSLQRCGCASQGRQPVRRHGYGGQRVAMDRRVSSTNTPARPSCAEEATTSRRARSGISRRPTRTIEHGKLLLMAPSYDRSGAIGFRCVKDAE